MKPENYLKVLCVFASCALLSACEPINELSVQADGNGGAVLGMSPPSFLTDARVVDQSLLELQVTANSISVPMSQNANGVWQGTISFDPSTDVDLRAAWSERGNPLLPLASFSRSFNVGDDTAGLLVGIVENRFNTNFDSDGDNRSNIAELRANTNPRSNASPGTEPELLPVKINFGVPMSLQSQSDAVINALSLTVVVNGNVFIVTRNGNVWSGQTTEVAGNDVFIEANFFSNSSRTDLLDRYEIRHALDANGLFIGLDALGPSP